jgi:hypothetical protein
MLPRSTRHDQPHDVGTLWTMARREHRARCALMAWANEWELRIIIDGVVILTERCDGADATFEIGAQIKERMAAEGWQQIIPRSFGNHPPTSLS